MSLDEAFDKFTIMSIKMGRFAIKCKKGILAVDVPTKSQAVREEKHYFAQYYADGEYGI